MAAPAQRACLATPWSSLKVAHRNAFVCASYLDRTKHSGDETFISKQSFDGTKYSFFIRFDETMLFFSAFF